MNVEHARENGFDLTNPIDIVAYTIWNLGGHSRSNANFLADHIVANLVEAGFDTIRRPVGH